MDDYIMDIHWSRFKLGPFHQLQLRHCEALLKLQRKPHPWHALDQLDSIGRISVIIINEVVYPQFLSMISSCPAAFGLMCCFFFFWTTVSRVSGCQNLGFWPVGNVELPAGQIPSSYWSSTYFLCIKFVHQVDSTSTVILLHCWLPLEKEWAPAKLVSILWCFYGYSMVILEGKSPSLGPCYLAPGLAAIGGIGVEQQPSLMDAWQLVDTPGPQRVAGKVCKDI